MEKAFIAAALRGILLTRGVRAFVREVEPATFERVKGRLPGGVIGEGDSGDAFHPEFPCGARDGARRFLADDRLERLAAWCTESDPEGVLALAPQKEMRLWNRVGVVTGGAQGFGAGLVKALLAEGAAVVAVDVNRKVGEAFVEECNRQIGAGRAFFFSCNVTAAADWEALSGYLEKNFGGLDLLVSNAGVLRAAPLDTLSEADFDLVTNVNYKGYFLGVRALAPLMAAQNAAAPGHYTDIVQINSKSGLEGSNRNFAYAGSKFGGIGLTQSFALELVEKNIKVNSVCPGNFFDGPLWSDPQNGLFVQYLRARKVPGAETVAEVRAFYEAKVPMGRGCLEKDVARAILYLVEQEYETGQAVPVTGGQVMLN